MRSEDEVVTARCHQDRLSLDRSNLDGETRNFRERAGQRIQFQHRTLRSVLDELDSGRQHFRRQS